MEKVVIFCISGQKRAGKDTIANYIMDNVITARVSFADPVREVCRAYFGWDDDWLLGENKEDVDPYWGISPRQAMQYLGTEVGRIGIAQNYSNFYDITGDSIWIKNAQRTIRKRISNEEYSKFGVKIRDEYNEDYSKFGVKIRAVVIPDMRFLNEYDAMKKMSEEGYKIITIGVRRNGLPSDNHASETEIKYCVEKCDFILENDKDIPDLHKKIHQFLINTGIEFKPDWMLTGQKQLGFGWESIETK